MLSRRCKHNVFDSQFVRFARIITSVDSFIDSIARLMIELVQKGFGVALIMKSCRLKIRDFPSLFGVSSGLGARYAHGRGLYQAICKHYYAIGLISDVRLLFDV